jgi:protein-tyrosine phosphatase
MNESVLCRQNGIDFIRYPIKDRNVPKDLNSYLNLITEIDKRLDKGEKIIIHCRMGIGRTGITAASVLTKNGWEQNEVFKRLSEIRTLEIPDTQEQIEFIKEVKDALNI